jgi:hypothetical protein
MNIDRDKLVDVLVEIQLNNELDEFPLPIPKYIMTHLHGVLEPILRFGFTGYHNMTNKQLLEEHEAFLEAESATCPSPQRSKLSMVNFLVE